MQILTQRQLQLPPLALARLALSLVVILGGVGMIVGQGPAARHRLLGRHA